MTVLRRATNTMLCAKGAAWVTAGEVRRVVPPVDDEGHAE